MIFILVFCALAVSMASLSGVNLQIADNQRKANSALSAAQSGLDVGKYLVNGYSKTSTIKTAGDVTQTDRNNTWNAFRTYISNSSNTVAGKPWTNTGPDLVSSYINFGSNNEKFQVKYHYDGNNITLESTGIVPTSDGSITKKATVGTNIERNGDVLNYAIASRGRMWLTGDSTIHGNIYSAWQYQNISPFNMTSDSTVEGTINTILSDINPNTGKTGPDLYADKFDSHGNPVLDADGNRVKIKMPYDLETLDANGNPVYDDQGNKVISPTDQIQGQCEGINYGVNYGDKAVNMPGMKITDYDTNQYKTQTTVIPTADYNTTTITEYAPHAKGNYNLPKSSGSLKLTRYVCKNKTLANVMVPANKNALFENCTFNGILYVDGGKSGTYNNIRFDNCTFNGPIVTTPSTDTSSGWWQRNQLYFTGSATFQNQTDVPATILAPNFSLDIGNTNPNGGDDNKLTGAIVGGIVDIRGNAEIYGTVISMYDTSGYSSGYVSNIGATSDDGGSETTDPGDIGVINITPDPDKLLPSGITTPIVIKPLQDTYSEG
jgi:hypothetical protein